MNLFCRKFVFYITQIFLVNYRFMEPLLERGCHLLAGVASVIDNMTYPTMALYFHGNRYIVTYEIFRH